ncbi:MAG: DUF1566 domain-containing protein [Treponema sp.]|nr:DUF1566 domain-containing protein [Treponema sp.]
MKRFVLIVALMALLGAGLFAQQLTVAVSTFEARSGLTKDDADAITDLFIAALVSDGSVNVVNRSSLDKIMAEMKFQASDWTNNERVVQLGKALNASSIIQGSVMVIAGSSALTSTILDLNTAQIISSSTLRMKDMSEVFDKMQGFVKELMEKLPKPRSTIVYKIGDKGPAGGFIFYDKGNYSNNWRYLEAAPLELEFVARWGDGNVSGAHTVIGSGKRNTEFMLAEANARKWQNTASQFCSNLNYSGYRDWFIPSRDELDLMYKNLKVKGIGSFSDDRYFSSSQSDGSYAFGQNFYNGSIGNSDYGKHRTYSVRPIRSF